MIYKLKGGGGSGFCSRTTTPLIVPSAIFSLKRGLALRAQGIQPIKNDQQIANVSLVFFKNVNIDMYVYV